MAWTRFMAAPVLTSLIWAAAGTAMAGTTLGDLCTGNPCVISSDAVVGSGASLRLDFGDADVVLEAVLDSSTTSLTVVAGSFTVRDEGQLRGGAIAVFTERGITLDGTRSTGSARIITDRGELTLSTVTGDVSGSGDILFVSTGIAHEGGTLIIDSGGDVTLSGRIEAIGGNTGVGGTVELDASGDISLAGPIDLSGGSGGGYLKTNAAGALRLGAVTLDGDGNLGEGGSLQVDADGDISLTGAIRARGSAAPGADCGDGGEVRVTSQRFLRIEDDIDLRARAGDCCGGDAVIETVGATILGDVLADGSSGAGCAGTIEMIADEDLSCSTSFSATGAAAGGDIVLESLAAFTLVEECVVDVSGPSSSVNLHSDGRLRIDGAVIAGLDTAVGSGGATPRGGVRTGVVEMRGCPIEIGLPGSARSLGSGAEIHLRSLGNIAIAGTMTAAAANRLVIPPGFSVEVQGSVLPPPDIVEDDRLLPCLPPATPTSTATGTPATATPAPPSPSATATPSSTPVITALPCLQPCVGDCNGDCAVTISELIRAVQIALGGAADQCAAADRDGDGAVGIAELVAAVGRALAGC